MGQPVELKPSWPRSLATTNCHAAHKALPRNDRPIFRPQAKRAMCANNGANKAGASAPLPSTPASTPATIRVVFWLTTRTSCACDPAGMLLMWSTIGKPSRQPVCLCVQHQPFFSGDQSLSRFAAPRRNPAATQNCTLTDEESMPIKGHKKQSRLSWCEEARCQRAQRLKTANAARHVSGACMACC